MTNPPFPTMNDQTTPPVQCQDTGSCDVTPASESNLYSALGGQSIRFTLYFTKNRKQIDSISPRLNKNVFWVDSELVFLFIP